MDYLERFLHEARMAFLSVILLCNIVLIGVWWICLKVIGLNLISTTAIIVAVVVIEALIVSTKLTDYLMQPLEALWQGILHIAPNTTGIEAPKPEDLKLGRELVTNLMVHIYQMVSVTEKLSAENNDKIKQLSANFIAQNLPLPLIVLDPSETIKFANTEAAKYLGIQPVDLMGKNVYMVLDMAFPSDDTFDNWLKKVKSTSATAVKAWERVKLDVRDNHPTLLFDLAAYYNRDNPDGNETMIVLFDHTKQYSQDDQAISFVALSVHELRTPLTLLRGYIEVFQDELSDQLSPELKNFMEKMQAQAEQLMAFVNNILNVARIDDDQLELKLQEADWPTILKTTIESISLRAKVRGISLNCKITGQLPSVGVDRLSIQEVINNLVDNAIKYSGSSKDINIETYLTKDGLIETTVQDFGLGIPTAVMPNLFTKFYRDHHNRAQIGGTGLGLYLSKAIIQAHGGNLWVRSKEGQGSTFGFTLQPYSSINNAAKENNDSEIVRGAHGWIKNHSLYRR